ncbi:Radical SAM domain protein [Candidatus Terasakiella magnetica]|uniref:Radical SAM domain protein n=1 Tax=Candidatus Terasakiella magnetica TaxID=1867952 RepID=A0A1C3RJ97_9PROT|nr:radical SAM protein [Candidatus Terasakiella magnetica]SCA57344.1 Radical SAM domain protein [Candidatus Terasakiella magnetica]
MDSTLQYQKFEHPDITAKGETRALVGLTHLHTLWFNTGSLCNITCQGCYMESSPKNDSLAYITLSEVESYLDEIADHHMDVREIGLTGGEPFMNPDIIPILTACLERGFEVLVLSNAMKPLHQKKAELLGLKETYGDKLGVRVSVDHYLKEDHESLRGQGSWDPMIEGLSWLAQNGFKLAIAGRTVWHEDEASERAGYGEMFVRENIPVDAQDPMGLVLFPEMDEQAEVPEITVACWDIVGVQPEAMMCATSRMIIKRKGADHPVVVPCTLLPYDEKFEMGAELSKADKEVKLNHPHCAKFCVLGGGSCSKA